MQLDNELIWLMEFYKSLCNGTWEHGFGCKIENIDNPGWSFEFDLHETVFENCAFDRVVSLRSDENWINCWFEKGVFTGIGGPLNLSEILSIFRDWIERTGL